MTEQTVKGNVAGDVVGGDIVNHAPKIQINGGMVMGNVIYMQSPAAPPRVKVVIQPGPEHIADEQKARLKALVDDVVKLESAARRSPKSHAAVWGALNKRMRASSYHLIKAVDYDRAEKFLREWIGRLSSTKTAEKKDPDWRKRKYSYIFLNVKQLNAQDRLDALLHDPYLVKSLKELTNEQLAAVYQKVASWKRAGPARQGAGAA